MLPKAFNEYFAETTPFIHLNESVGILKHLTHLEELILTDKKFSKYKVFDYRVKDQLILK